MNLKLYNAARDGRNDAVLAAITAGSNVNWNNGDFGLGYLNWKNDSHVSDNNI